MMCTGGVRRYLDSNLQVTDGDNSLGVPLQNVLS